MLQADYEAFKKLRDSLLKDHHGEYAIIKDEALVSITKTQDEAFLFMKDEVLGSFLIQQILSEAEDTIKYYSANVAFA